MDSSKQKVAGGLFWSYGERIMAQLVSLIVSIVLARLLDPENYGVISIVMIFITLLQAVLETQLFKKKMRMSWMLILCSSVVWRLLQFYI